MSYCFSSADEQLVVECDDDDGGNWRAEEIECSKYYQSQNPWAMRNTGAGYRAYWCQMMVDMAAP